MNTFPSVEDKGSAGVSRGGRRQVSSRRQKKSTDGNTIYLQVIAICGVIAVLWFATIELRIQVHLYRMQQAFTELKNI